MNEVGENQLLLWRERKGDGKKEGEKEMGFVSTRGANKRRAKSKK